MHTLSQFVFRFVTIRSRISAAVLALSLPLGFALLSLGWTVEVKAASASGYLYVLNDCPGCPNRIFGFAVDETTGVLTPTNGFPVSTGGNGTDGFSSELLTMDRKNLRLFVLNSGSKTVSAFTINPATGKLTAMMFSPITLNGTGSFTTIAAHPSSRDTLLVIGGIELNNSGGFLSSYRITTTAAIRISDHQSTGAARPLYTAFRQDGRFVYTGGGGPASKFAGFSITASGTLSTLNNTGFESRTEDPRGYAMDAQGRLFIANRCFQCQQLRVFTTTNGIPNLISSTPVLTPLREVGQGVLHPNGQFYVVSDSSINVDLVVVYKFNSTNHTTPLTPVFASGFHSGGTAVKLLAFSKAGNYLFAGNQDTHNLTTFLMMTGTGVLFRLATQAPNTLGTSGALNGIAYHPSLTTTAVIIAPAVTRRSIPGEIAPVTINVSCPASFATPSGNVSLVVDGGEAITKALSY